MRQRPLPLPRLGPTDGVTAEARPRARARRGPLPERRGVVASPLEAAAAVAPVSVPAPDLAELPALVVATADASLLRMLTFALQQLRLPHETYTSGTAVLQALLDLPQNGRPMVVLLDVDLPGVDGHAILERLGVERPDAFLIAVLSSHADESVQVRSLLAGALDHLAKPFNIRVLMAKVQRWVRMARHYEVAA